METKGYTLKKAVKDTVIVALCVIAICAALTNTNKIGTVEGVLIAGVSATLFFTKIDRILTYAKSKLCYTSKNQKQ